MRSIALVALGLAAFAAAIALIGAAAPLSPPAGIREKLLIFERERDTTDVLFFGSSHLHRGLDPRTFDEEAGGAGSSVRSFNFAMPSMRAHEANALLRHVLAMHPARLRWVILEWGRWDPVIAPANWWKERPIFWHDAQETRSVVASVWIGDFDLPRKLALTKTHALHFLQRTLAVGRGPTALHGLIGSVDAPSFPGPTEVHRRGFSPFTPDEYRSGPTAEHRRTYLADREAFEASLRTLALSKRGHVDARKANLRALASQIQTVRAAGAEPVYVVMPIAKPTPLAHALEADGTIPHLIAFNDPDRYPRLYESSARFDRGHLNERGAELLSRKLAVRFAALLAGEPTAE